MINPGPAFAIIDMSVMACERLLRKTLIFCTVYSLFNTFLCRVSPVLPLFRVSLDLAPRFGILMKKYIIGTALSLLPYGHNFTRRKRFYHMRQQSCYTRADN
ncbi:hypothetical protein V8E52_007559 [Russula decolorans]